MHFTSYIFIMTFSWTPHRFSGGALALDIANSVILRADPERRVDRLADPENWQSLPDAASTHSAERALFPVLEPVAAEDQPRLLRMREAIDAHFRGRISGRDDPLTLADLLEQLASTFRLGRPASSLLTATAHSALRLLSEGNEPRLKQCSHCGWLFLDRSKNRSRLWCDMAVCGNRTKAARHYRRRKETAS